MIEILIVLLLSCQPNVLGAEKAPDLRQYIGRAHGRDGLKGFTVEDDLSHIEYAGAFYFMTKGRLLETEVLVVRRADKRDEKGRVSQYTVTDVQPVSPLMKGQHYAGSCTNSNGLLRGASGIIQWREEGSKSGAWGRVLKVYQIDPKGHLKEIPPDGINCEGPSWGAD